MVKSKWLSFVLVFAMLVTMFVPMGMTNAFAAGTEYNSIEVPSISDDTNNARLGSFAIDINPLYSGSTSEAWVELPQDKDYKIHQITVNNDTVVDFDEDTSVSGTIYDVDNNAIGTFKISSISEDGFKLQIKNTNTYSKEVILPISFDKVDVPSGVEGDIKVTITNISGQLVSGSVVIATVGTGDLTVNATNTNSFSDEGGTVKIRIAETSAGKLNSDDEFKLELPDGFEWGSVSDKTLVYGEFNDDEDVTASEAVSFTSDGDTLIVKLKDGYESTKKVAIDFVANIEVTDTSKADEGTIVAKVKGDYDVTPTELTVGTYGDYNVSVTAEDSSTVVFAGQNDQGVSDIKIKEAVKGSLIEGRTILITLPSNARWYKIDDQEVNPYTDDDQINDVDSDNGVTLSLEGLQGTDYRTAKFKITGSSSDSDDPAELTIENVSVALDSGTTGDLVATVSGSQGIDDEITLAKVVNPVTVTADKTDVKLGVSEQAAGDITISEYQDGAIDTNDGDDPITLELPDGVKFSSKPTVTVTSGDIEVDHTALTDDDSTLEIYFKDDSEEASTIKISNIKYDIDRTVGEGDIQVKVGGDALVTVAGLGYKDNDEDTHEFFSGNDYITKVANATVVTPAPNATNQTAVFTINSTTYTVNGVQNTLDSAPYVKNGRTYLPTRYVAYALGVSSDNVLWDGTKATFILGNRVVQVVPGTTTLIINGATVTMDAPAEIVNGRVMVPFRWIAQAFGAQVQWDATNQTVTMTLQAQ